MADSHKDLEDRIENLERERQGKFRFFIQYLLSPLLVVVVGIIFNWQLEQDKKEIQQLQIAQTMLQPLFSEDKFKTLATKRLMDEVIESEKLKTEIGKIVEDYLTMKFNQSFKEGDYESAQDILDATSTMGGLVGENIAKGIEQDKKATLGRYQRARPHELKGFDALVNGNFDLALEEFGKAKDIYPDLHSVSEIHALLESHQSEFGEQETRLKIIKTILEKYTWKVPKDIIQDLRD